MSTVKTSCDKCGAIYAVPADRVGSQSRCSKCQAIFTIKTGGSLPVQGVPKAQVNAGGFPNPVSQPGPSAAAYAQAAPKQQSASPDKNQAWPSYTPPTGGPNNSRPLPPNPAQASAGPQTHNYKTAPLNRNQSGPQGQARPSTPAPGPAVAARQSPGGASPQASFGPAASAAAAGGMGGNADKFQKWSDGLIINTRCPRCNFSFPINKGLLDKSVNCPGCKKPFFAADNYGWVDDPKGGVWSRLMSDKRFLYALPIFFVLLIILNITVPRINDRLAASSLKSTLEKTYLPPDYEISIRKITKKPGSSLRIPDGSKTCSRYALTNIAHQSSGMEFARAMCHSSGNWTPDFYQTVADKVAYDRLDNPFASPMFDPGEMISGAVNLEAANRRDTFKSEAEMAIHEARMLEADLGPAIYNLSRLGHDGASSARRQSDYEDDSSEDGWWNDEDSFSIKPVSYYSVERLIQRQGKGVIYKAHAVMYPDQVDELMARGLITERP